MANAYRGSSLCKSEKMQLICGLAYLTYKKTQTISMQWHSCAGFQGFRANIEFASKSYSDAFVICELNIKSSQTAMN